MVESVFLKSNRVEDSRFAWSTALRTSCMSTSETMSNVGIAPAYRSLRLAPRSIESAGRGQSEAGLVSPAGRCPSGQRKQTVNLPAQPTQVQILPGPPCDVARHRRHDPDSDRRLVVLARTNVQGQRHEGAIRTGAVVGERSAGLETHRGIERPCRSERGRRPGLQTHAPNATGAGDGDEVVDQGPADAATARRLGRVHGLDLGVVRLEMPQRADSEELPLEAEAVERDRRIKEAVRVECVDVLGRCVGPGERQVVFQQGMDVIHPRVVDRFLAVGHSWNLGKRQPKEPLRDGEPPLQWDYISVSAVPGSRSAGTISGSLGTAI